MEFEMKPNGCLGFILIIIGIAIAVKGEGCSPGIGIGLILGGITCFADTTKKELGKPGVQGVKPDALSDKIAAASAEVASLSAEAAALSAEIAAVSAEIKEAAIAEVAPVSAQVTATASAEVAPVAADVMAPASAGVIPTVDQSKLKGDPNAEMKDNSTTRLWLIGTLSAATAFFATAVAFHLIRHERGGTAAGPAMWISLVLTIVFTHRFWKAE
jgi:hypothetical protein